MARAASLEGRASPYAASSATYQSIEGLMEGLRDEVAHNTSLLHMSQSNHHNHIHHHGRHQHSQKCNTCGSRSGSSSASSRKNRFQRCGHHPHNQQSGSCNSNNNCRASSVHSMSHHCCLGPNMHAIPTSAEETNRLPKGYTPNFYGWTSPPVSPKVAAIRRGTSLDGDNINGDGSSIYAGSVRSDNGGDYGWSRNCSNTDGGGEESICEGSSVSGEGCNGVREGMKDEPPICSPDSSAVEMVSDAVSCGSCEETEASFYATCDKQTKL